MAKTLTNTDPAARTASRSENRAPLLPFTHETAVGKVRAAEDGWNSRDPQTTVLGYSLDSRWRNQAEFVTGRSAIVEFLKCK